VFTTFPSRSPSDRLRIVILGYIVRFPVGGGAWPYLQYVLGLARLGHDVYYLEDSGDNNPYCCFDPDRLWSDTNPTYGLRFAVRAFESVGLGERLAYYDSYTSRWLGPLADQIMDICSTADLLINTPALATTLRPWLEEIPARALIDLDPTFTQIFHLINPAARRWASKHTAFFSFGENIFRGSSSVPDDGFPWQATRPPVVLDVWPVAPVSNNSRFTTVMNWDSYPARDYDGRHYGMKSDSFGPYMDLPKKAGAAFELAVGSHSAPREELAANGWILRDPLQVTRDLWTYRRYVQQSRGEFSVAKHGYVVSNSGWFSDRSAAYLASGRPVLIQEAGFSEWLPTGSGVLTFKSPEEALGGIDDINHRYEFHCRAAREIAAEYFDSAKVLSHLVDSAINTSKSLNR
jgi:hypothetical protein